MHTTYSDGAMSPAELMEKVSAAGLNIISITDHDTVSAIAEARQLGEAAGVEVVPGVELSATADTSELHILGYFIDWQHGEFLGFLSEFREQRRKRAERIIDKLNQMNIPLSMDSVLAQTTGESIGRPHIASALVNEGHAESYYQAFNKFIGNGKPAYEQKMEISPEDIVRLIARVGGLSFLAHPGKSVSEQMLFRLIKAGLDGIEVIHPSHSAEMVRYYRGIVSEYFLLESGGSDYHGGPKNDEHLLGNYTVPGSTVEAMRKRLFNPRGL